MLVLVSGGPRRFDVGIARKIAYGHIKDVGMLGTESWLPPPSTTSVMHVSKAEVVAASSGAAGKAEVDYILLGYRRPPGGSRARPGANPAPIGLLLHDG